MSCRHWLTSTDPLWRSISNLLVSRTLLRFWWCWLWQERHRGRVLPDGGIPQDCSNLKKTYTRDKKSVSNCSQWYSTCSEVHYNLFYNRQYYTWTTVFPFKQSSLPKIAALPAHNGVSGSVEQQVSCQSDPRLLQS